MDFDIGGHKGLLLVRHPQLPLLGGRALDDGGTELVANADRLHRTIERTEKYKHGIKYEDGVKLDGWKRRQSGMANLSHDGSGRLREGHCIERFLFEVSPNIATLIGGHFDELLNLASDVIAKTKLQIKLFQTIIKHAD